jgi:hypothetical protein
MKGSDEVGGAPGGTNAGGPQSNPVVNPQTIIDCGNCGEPTPVGELTDGPGGLAVCPACGRGEGADGLRTDGGLDAEKRLDKAVRQIVLARSTIDARRDPGRDAALARAEMMVRGVADALKEEA